MIIKKPQTDTLQAAAFVVAMCCAFLLGLLFGGVNRPEWGHTDIVAIADERIRLALEAMRPDTAAYHTVRGFEVSKGIAALDSSAGATHWVDHLSVVAERDALKAELQPPAPSRFEDRGDTIYDHQTGLEWEQGTRGVMPWQEAVDSCAALRIGGHDDWRLPTMEELLTPVDFERYNPACDAVFKTQSNFYWSSSTYQRNPDFAWAVSFFFGFTDADFKTDSLFVRAVRGGKEVTK